MAQEASDAYKIRTFETSGNAEVEVTTSGGFIRVIGTNKSEVEVQVFVRKRNRYYSEDDIDLKDYELSIVQRGNRVIAEAKRKGNDRWGWNNNNYSVSFVVYAPVNTTTNLSTSGGSIVMDNMNGDQEARTSGGSVKATAIAGRLDLRTSGGSMTMEQISGKVQARTSGGKIVARNVTGDVDVSTSGGSITAEGIRGNLSARTSGGSINAEVVNPDDYIELRTSGGSINIVVPEQGGYDLELDGGRVRADLKNFNGEYEKDEISGKMNGGGTRISARTSGGSVRLNYL